MIQTKRVYEPAEKRDGKRFLVDRLWPRGVKKEALKSAAWLKEIAPSDPLRHWFNHDPARWQEFQERYSDELTGKPEMWKPLIERRRMAI